MATDHNSKQCLKKHWACLVLEKTIHLIFLGKGLAVWKQLVLEKTTCKNCFVTTIGFGKDQGTDFVSEIVQF